MHTGNHRRRLLAAAAALGSGMSSALRAQETRGPLRIIVPLPAGGVADTAVRIFAEQWTLLTRQNVVVDNRPGASFLIGVQQLTAAAPDGNTWLHMNSGMSAVQASYQRYDILRQIVPLGMMGSTPGAIFVNAASPHQNVRELLDWIRANPAKHFYGAVAGGIEHLSSANLLRRYGLSGTMVPFKGGPDTCTALAQNEIQLAITALPLVIPFKGRIRPLAVMTEQRSPMLPDVPTFREQGLDVPELNYWGAFGVPVGTPAATIAALNRSMTEVLKLPAVSSKYLVQGMVSAPSMPEPMARVIAEEVKWMTPVAAALNLKAE